MEKKHMGFLKNIFTKGTQPVRTNSKFWDWFKANEKTFFGVVKNNKDIESNFFQKLSTKLDELKDGFFFLAGMLNDNTVELIITADGNIKNIVFAEELVAQAPSIKGWKFTALKPPIDANVEMNGYSFNSEDLFFYSNVDKNYPDKIDISIIHNALTEENKNQIETGVYVFLDNYLGELNFVNTIDNIDVIARNEATDDLVPITKLKDFLIWREKEFVEKYDGVRYNTVDDEHAVMEAELESGNRLIATVNTKLLEWDSKPSHPWIAVLIIKYKGSGGMPDKKDQEILYTIQEDVEKELADKDGYLTVGRQTAKNEREIYFACKEFRKPSKVLFNIEKNMPLSIA
ncbi:MAG: DUF695 domain-containing protein [Sphingobacteriales bacterium JAD_PAG50586_3]|nr:MAG: DUF695 domain-containing protein [Sphingobacteriales bacterium JAD_PAG50586_3]